jgi:hypothetical protein
MSQSSGFQPKFNDFTPPVYNATPIPPPTPPPIEPIIPKAKTECENTNEVGEIETIPKARICWPSVNLYVLGTEITFTLRPLYQHQKIDVLVIPYRNLKFDLYGGNIINSCTYDYRKRI